MVNTIYIQGKQVGSFNNWDELRLGASHPSFIYKGEEIVYPNIVQNDLFIWYDFTGITNDNTLAYIARDHTDKNSYGFLSGFLFTSESGYNQDKLTFDGVDDMISVVKNFSEVEFTMQLCCRLRDSENIQTIFENDLSVSLKQNGNKHFIISMKNDTSTPIVSEVTVDESFTDKIILITLVKSNEGIQLFINNQRIMSSTFSTSKALTNPLVLMNNSEQTSPSKGDLFSFKMYSRPLTLEEIAHNYAIEKERFGIE